jgi:hypothetical protein
MPPSPTLTVVALCFNEAEGIDDTLAILNELARSDPSLLLGRIRITFLGVLGGYLARVCEEAKGRPLYLLEQGPDAR